MDKRYNIDPEKVEKKIRLSLGLYEFAYKLKKEILANKHPDWPEKELHEKTVELIHKGCR
jgi:hypothetical protein